MYPDDTIEDVGFAALLVLGFVTLVLALELAILGD